MVRYEVTRDVTTEECPWLRADVLYGSVVYEYSGATYGCIGGDGEAVSLKPNEGPFFELPLSALVRV